MNIQQYLDNAKHLPEFMKDFHDQKDLFKAMYQQWQSQHRILEDVAWTDSLVFTIDIFLWWMAVHGYKLQKDRTKNVPFNDPVDTIQHYKDIRRGAATNIINETNNP